MATPDSAVPVQVPSFPVKPNYFGLDMTNTPSLPFRVKFESFRFWDNGCRWPNVNPARGQFNSAPIQAWLAALISSGVKDCIFELGGTPQWASSMPNNTGCDYFKYAAGSCAPPSDLHADGTGPNQFWRDWCKFIGQLFSKYPQVQVSGWCPWNEFTRQADWAGDKSWVGTPQQMVRLAQDARAIILGRGHIHATNESPQQALATVGLKAPAYSVNTLESYMLSPSGGPVLPQLAHMIAYLQTPGAVNAAEIMALHLYELTGQDAVASAIRFKSAIAQFVEGKPIWMTEGSCGTRTPNQPMDQFVYSWYTLLHPIVDRNYWYAYMGDAAALWDGSNLTEAGVAYMKLRGKL
jgi:hypothetical protein